MSFISNIFGNRETKEKEGTSPITAFEETREGMPKSYIPNFFYKPPFRLSKVSKPNLF